jgi:8-oxo-dGTP pyrophosphatase MutT (NUDIX family)
VRLSARLFVLDPAGRLLLLDCVDPARPDVRWWELPGGGVEPGEDEVAAAVREVAEETGVHVPVGLVGPLQWTQDSTFRFRGRRHWTRCHGYLARLSERPVPGPAVLTEAERGSLLGSRWWSPAEVAAWSGRFFPSTLASALPQVLAGERVDDPFDTWD